MNRSGPQADSFLSGGVAILMSAGTILANCGHLEDGGVDGARRSVVV